MYWIWLLLLFLMGKNKVLAFPCQKIINSYLYTFKNYISQDNIWKQKRKMRSKSLWIKWLDLWRRCNEEWLQALLLSLCVINRHNNNIQCEQSLKFRTIQSFTKVSLLNLVSEVKVEHCQCRVMEAEFGLIRFLHRIAAESKCCVGSLPLKYG